MNLKNNLTTIVITILAIVIVMLLALIIILDKDPTTYIGSLSTLVGLLVTTGLLGNRLDKVSKNVNGNTTKLLNENAQLRARNATLEASQGVGFTPSVPLMSEDTVGRIAADRDALPEHRA